MSVVSRRCDLQRDSSDVLRRGLRKVLRAGTQYLRDIRNGRGRSCNRLGAVAGNQDVNFVPELLRSGDRVKRCGFESGVVVLGDDQYRHGRLSESLISIDYRKTLASFRNLATSSFTSATRPPPLRFGGSATRSVFSRGATSTPNDSGVSVSSGFFFAFMRPTLRVISAETNHKISSDTSRSGSLAAGFEQELVDGARLAQLEDIARDNSFLGELIAGFISDVDDILQKVNQAIAQDNRRALPDLMHSLKGAAVGVGAVKLASLASDLDQSVDQVKFAEIVSKLQHIETCFESTAAFLKRYLEMHHQ